MDKWQPIETAPKDGTSILIVTLQGYMTTVRWEGESCCGGWALIVDGTTQNCEADCSSDLPKTPTHWMPLPEPPQP